MKALLYVKNAPGKLVYTDVKTPVPKDNEVLVKVFASSVNAADYRSMKMGIIPPKKIFGADISGVIESVGKAIQQFKAGDEVIGDLSNYGFGGFAEYAVAPEKALVLKPENIPFEEAASLPLAGVTALQALRDKGHIQEGKKVLIVGSSGGVGTFAVQLARYFGATVTGVCSPANIGQTKRLGVDRVIDYTKVNFCKETGAYDLIIAVNGSYPLLSYKRCLKVNGRYVLIGGALPQILKTLIFGKLLSCGSKKMYSLFAKPCQRDLEFIAKLASEKKIRFVIEASYTLDKAAEAMRHVAEGHARGKVVIRVK